jgi:hypothetical protein
MEELTSDQVRELLLSPTPVSSLRLPKWLKHEHLKYMFPVSERPSSSIAAPSVASNLQVSSRRAEDEARRKAMHSLITTWEKGARLVARQLVDVVYRGGRIGASDVPASSLSIGSGLSSSDTATITAISALIPPTPSDMVSNTASITSLFTCHHETFSYVPITTIGGYSVTPRAGPLCMLSRLVASRQPATLWLKARVRVSHGRRRVSIEKRTGRITLFDRHMNLVFIPSGAPSSQWEFIRGSMVALVVVSK